MALNASRDEQIANFYREHAARLHRGICGKAVGLDDATVQDACAIAWERLLGRPDMNLERYEAYWWLYKVALREAWALGRRQRRAVPPWARGRGDPADSRRPRPGGQPPTRNAHERRPRGQATVRHPQPRLARGRSRPPAQRRAVKRPRIQAAVFVPLPAGILVGYGYRDELLGPGYDWPVQPCRERDSVRRGCRRPPAALLSDAWGVAGAARSPAGGTGKSRP